MPQSKPKQFVSGQMKQPAGPQLQLTDNYNNKLKQTHATNQ